MMKRSLLLTLCLMASSLLLLGGRAPLGEDALRKYVKSIEGTWISMPDYSSGYDAMHPDLLIDIDVNLVENGQVKIFVSDYCEAGIADYLNFELEGERLKYVGASQDGCFFDMTRLDFVYLAYEAANGDTLLTYEAQETEYANYTFYKLLRMPPANPVEGWACRLQGFMTTFLREGRYRIVDPHGCELSLAEAFGTDAAVVEMAFANEHPVLFPMLEELGVSTPFDFIITGTTHPGGNAQIYAIDWHPTAIYLYETFLDNNLMDGSLELVKGSLRFMLAPDFASSTLNKKS